MSTQSVSFFLYETVTITFQLVSVLLNGAIVLCTLHKKSLIRCPSTKFVFSLCVSHLLISIMSLAISIIQPFVKLSVGEAVASNFTPTPTTTANFVSSFELTAVSSTTAAVTDNKSIAPREDDSLHHDQHHVPDTTPTANISHVLNYVILYFTLIVMLGTSFTLAVISIERYITIARPMRYKSIITSARSTLSIMFCWFFAIMFILSPILIFGNRIKIYKTFAIPTGQLGLYFAFLFSCTTLSVLAIMVVCYGRIFKIAKEKCQKVQIGQFTSPVSSISSDWPSSVYSSAGGTEGHFQHHVSITPSPERTTNLAIIPQKFHRTATTIPATEFVQYNFICQSLEQPRQNLRSQISLPSSPRNINNTLGLMATPTAVHYGKHKKLLTSASVPIPVSSFKNVLRLKKWATFLQQNYNSPKKTISTIILLISSLVLTQIPLCIGLFYTPKTLTVIGNEEGDYWAIYPAANTGSIDIDNNGGPSLLYFCLKFLFSLSSIMNPVLYGFLNRNIRNHLWKFLNIRRTTLRKKHQLLYHFTPPNSPSSKSCRNSMDYPRKLSPTVSCPIPIISITLPECQKPLQQVAREQLNETVSIASNEVAGKEEADIVVKKSSESSQNKNGIANINESQWTIPTIRTSIYEENEDCDGLAFEDTKGNQRKKSLFSEDEDEDELDDFDEIMDEELLSLSSFPRKPSQDSGADMAFSEDDDDDDEENFDDTNEDQQEQKYLQHKTNSINKEEVKQGETGRRKESKSEITLHMFEINELRKKKNGYGYAYSYSSSS